MKKFFGEFKKFITRGNVLDMSVGVIVGGAFTGIVNGLSNYILKPLINWILALVLGKDGLSGIITMLSGVQSKDADGNLLYEMDELGNFILDKAGNKMPVWDLAKSIYIDWGSFISAIINFFLIAIVLFCIVKTINSLKDGGEKVKKLGKYSKEDKKAMKAQGIKLRDKEAVEAYFAKKAEDEAKAKAEAEEKARLEKEANPTTEELLKKILVVLESK